MNGQKNYVWRFTLVHRFTLEKISEVFTFAKDLPHATNKIRALFPVALYVVEDTMCVSSTSVVIVGYSTLAEFSTKHYSSYED